MCNANHDPLVYYASHSKMTDPHNYAALLADLPTDIASVCHVVQGLIIHFAMGQRYGVELAARRHEAHVRAIAPVLARIQELDSRPLVYPRSPERRFVGSCRVATLLFCTFLRHHGIPVRARCGFSAYFADDFFGDHWVGEYWNTQEQRWMLVDAELDDLLRTRHAITFDPHDLPRDQWISAGAAWQACQGGHADATRFGFDPTTAGMNYIQSQLVRDVAALNKAEVGSWDTWGLANVQASDMSDEDSRLLDQMAVLTQSGNDAFSELRTLYKHEERLRPPTHIFVA